MAGSRTHSEMPGVGAEVSFSAVTLYPCPASEILSISYITKAL